MTHWTFAGQCIKNHYCGALALLYGALLLEVFNLYYTSQNFCIQFKKHTFLPLIFSKYKI